MGHVIEKGFCGACAGILLTAGMTGTKAWAQSEAALEEIVVTAQRRDENLQSVPIAVSAFTEDTLVKAGIDSTADLVDIAPGLVWVTGRSDASMYIRGVGTSSHGAGLEQAVAMYVDGIYYPDFSGSTLSLANIERVEVLRGPQGTLFGRNAVGGLVNVITKAPSQESGGLLEAGYGNYDSFYGKFYGTTGITANLAADFSVYYYDQAGNWGRNLFLNDDINTKEEFVSARSKWHWVPTVNTDVILAMDYHDRESDIGSHRNLLPGTVGLDGSGFVGDIYDSQENLSSDDLTAVAEQAGMSLTVEHDMDRFTIRSLTAYRDVSSKQFADVDATSVAFTDFAIHDSSTDAITQEIHVLSPDDSAFDWILGMFYMNRDAKFGALELHGLNFPPGGFRFITGWDVGSIAGFGQATFPVAADTNLTVGLRYTSDTTDYDISLLLLADGSTLVQATDDTTWSEPTWRVVLDHHFSDNVMGYASYNRGFKSGVYGATDTSATPINPEILDAYELGLKMDLADNRVRLNGVVFYNDYQDLQVEVFSGALPEAINAPSADYFGVEVDMEAVVTDRLNLRGNMSWMPDAEYSDFPFAPFFIPNPAGGNLEVPMNGEGQQITYTPEFTLNLGVDYTVPVPFGSLRFGANYYYNDGYFWAVDNRVSGNRRHIVNLSGTWRSPAERWNVRLWSNNLLDEEYYAHGSIGGTGDSMTAGAPRTVGISAGYHF